MINKAEKRKPYSKHEARHGKMGKGPETGILVVRSRMPSIKSFRFTKNNVGAEAGNVDWH